MQALAVVLLALLSLGALWLGWRAYRRYQSSKAKPQPLSPAQKRTPTLVDRRDVLQTAIFARSPATAATGMQWHPSWSSPVDDRVAVVFDAAFDRGLLLGVGRGMTDTNGGYVVHLLSPDRASQQASGGGEMLVYGLSDMLRPSEIRVTGLHKAENAGGFATRTFWFRHGPSECELGRGSVVGSDVIFKAPHRCADKHLRFIGFGTSCDSAYERTVTRVGFAQ
jgi:hypothetical protein